MEDYSTAVFPLPLGFHFEPTDDELLDYLTVKVFYGDESVPTHLPISRREIYAEEVPEQIFSGDLADAEEVYVFTTLKNKFEKGKGKGKGKEKRDRTVGNRGHWHGQRTTPVLNSAEDVLLGYKTMLNFFHCGSTKSGWIMHEYTLPYPGVNSALCHIYRATRDSSCDTPAPAALASSSSSSTAAEMVVGKGKRKVVDHEDDPVPRNQRARTEFELSHEFDLPPAPPFVDDVLLAALASSHDHLCVAPFEGNVTMDLGELMAMFDASPLPTSTPAPTPTEVDRLNDTTEEGHLPVVDPTSLSDGADFDPSAFFDGAQEEFQKLFG